MTHKKADALAYELGFPKQDLFVPKEFYRSTMAERFEIENHPTAKEWKNIIHLLRQLLLPLRQQYGKQIVISSGYRSSRVNSLVGGAKNSYHLYGRAVDIFADDLNALVNLIDKLPHSELIVHKNYIHVAL